MALGKGFGQGKTKKRRITMGGNGADGSRTHDLLHAMQALSQLSYGPGGLCILAQTR